MHDDLGHERATAAKHWYALRVFAGHEERVRAALQAHIRQHHLEDDFGEILVPVETITLPP